MFQTRGNYSLNIGCWFSGFPVHHQFAKCCSETCPNVPRYLHRMESSTTSCDLGLSMSKAQYWSRECYVLVFLIYISPSCFQMVFWSMSTKCTSTHFGAGINNYLLRPWSNHFRSLRFDLWVSSVNPLDSRYNIIIMLGNTAVNARDVLWYLPKSWIQETFNATWMQLSQKADTNLTSPRDWFLRFPRSYSDHLW